MLGFDVLALFFAAIGVAIGLGLMAFWIWMLIEAATKEPDQGNDKIVWILIIALLGWIGAAVYFFVRRPKRITQFGK